MIRLLAGLMLLLAFSGCYNMRSSNGGGQAHFVTPRFVNSPDIAVLDGYRIDMVASGLNFPTGVTFDDQGQVYVVESGYSYGEVWTVPRLVRIDAQGAVTEIARGAKNGPWTGVTFHDGNFYVCEGGVLEGGRVLRISPTGEITALISNLPSYGDHHVDGPVFSRDGWLYFAVGTASNSGVVGEDNAQLGWLWRKPQFHDIPGQNIALAGENFISVNPMDPKGPKVETGPFLPFGTTCSPAQVIKGELPCTGAVMRMRPDGSNLELVAWGFRNPFGLAFNPEGQLYVTENSYDDRGSRPVWGTPDVLWQVQKGLWYGWPDFAAGIPLNNGHFQPPGKPAPNYLLAYHPNPPPKPVAKFDVHASADGFDFSRNPAFGFTGQPFVALFGDLAPMAGKVLHPVGAKVVRVDLNTGVVQEFAVNKGRVNGPASKIGHGGFERPIAVRFNPQGDALYVVDFGALIQAQTVSEPHPGSGVLWRITRNQGL
ncbi:MAG: Glucose/sorbosone dehydrogenase-like protein [Pedosphaera sp.]|nr:Glucose/sorbosone dehydrogenase-like protein [Pedosphaera sp.]